MSDQEPQTDNQLLRIELLLEHITRRVDKMSDAFDGKGSDPGVMIRIDRLEQTAETNRKISWALVAGTIALAFAAIRNALHL